MATTTPEELWDAIVIGAGPAGAIAARQLALLGRRVLLVDKAKLPRDKVCGGCLGGAALHVLASVGLADVLRGCGSVPLKTFTLASGGAIASMPIGRRVAVSRCTFDDALVREAARAGVVVRDHTLGVMLRSADTAARQVVLWRRAEEITVRAKVVLVATGLARCPPSYTTHMTPGSRIGVGAVLEEPPCGIPAGTLLMACNASGYVGITAVERNRFDVAAAVDPHALAAARSPGRLINGILAEAGVASTMDLESIAWQGTPPLTRRTAPLASHRCVLIGDAVGYVEPFTGEGIGWAMHSAVMATSLLAGPLDTWDQSIPTQWQQAHDSALAGLQRSCRIVSRLLRVKPLRQLAVWGLSKAPSFSRPIVRRLDRPIAAPIV